VGVVLGDSVRLQQAIWNLLSNAVKFTNEGGRIEARLELAGDQIEITISDTGVGIEPQFLPYVFNRFRQADSTSTRRYGGLGLGLSIVRHIVEMHGGCVSASSPGEGQGATFKIRIPVASGQDLQQPQMRQPESEVKQAKAHLLPIDEAAEAQRAARVEQDVGPVAPGVAKYASLHPIKTWVAHMTDQLSHLSDRAGMIKIARILSISGPSPV